LPLFWVLPMNRSYSFWSPNMSSSLRSVSYCALAKSVIIHSLLISFEILILLGWLELALSDPNILCS
jgi:hypothetical protein